VIIGELYTHAHYGLVLLVSRTRILEKSSGNDVWSVKVYMLNEERITTGVFTEEEWIDSFIQTSIN
jgi:hypothetical protein